MASPRAPEPTQFFQTKAFKIVGGLVVLAVIAMKLTAEAPPEATKVELERANSQIEAMKSGPMGISQTKPAAPTAPTVVATPAPIVAATPRPEASVELEATHAAPIMPPIESEEPTFSETLAAANEPSTFTPATTLKPVEQPQWKPSATVELPVIETIPRTEKPKRKSKRKFASIHPAANAPVKISGWKVSCLSLEGEDLPAIAKRKFGDEKIWPRLWAANPHIKNPYVIPLQTVINLNLDENAE